MAETACRRSAAEPPEAPEKPEVCGCTCSSTRRVRSFRNCGRWPSRTSETAFSTIWSIAVLSAIVAPTTSPAECKLAQFSQQVSDYTASRSTLIDDGSNCQTRHPRSDQNCPKPFNWQYVKRVTRNVRLASKITVPNVCTD